MTRGKKYAITGEIYFYDERIQKTQLVFVVKILSKKQLKNFVKKKKNFTFYDSPKYNVLNRNVTHRYYYYYDISTNGLENVII